MQATPLTDLEGPKTEKAEAKSQISLSNLCGEKHFQSNVWAIYIAKESILARAGNHCMLQAVKLMAKSYFKALQPSSML